VQPGPDWPNVGFDFRPVMERINNALPSGCPDYEFVPTMATGPEDAEKILADDGPNGVDGYIVYQMNCWNPVVQTIAKSGKPVLYADFKYGGSGGFLVYTAAFLRKNIAPVDFPAHGYYRYPCFSFAVYQSPFHGGRSPVASSLLLPRRCA